MTIYPAIDIKGGRAVRLTQGRADQETVYAENPADVAKQFRAAGSEWVHVVDLDGAFAGEPQNLAAVQAIAALGMKVQLGGGLRTRAAVERALGFGVSRVVIGTRAAESEAFVGELVQAFGNQIAGGINVAMAGQPYWTHDMKGETWASTLVADGTVYLGTRRGDFCVLAAGKELKVLHTVHLDGPMSATPVAANGVLYVTTQKRLYAIEKK